MNLFSLYIVLFLFMITIIWVIKREKQKEFNRMNKTIELGDDNTSIQIKNIIRNCNTNYIDKQAIGNLIKNMKM